ncbi:hypothetical protein HG536_0C00680 [Torulaspora globosa]|uniref:Protein ATC1/LIC4 n=1 Tax=Torulaspora globosa TaxID=48254 RepID=A0A7G3ZEG5_9SACH|nr:uncharacterized protein HG536_0C00680 [Torulaspora globosa]QLL31901.1 hypothetical protein HG536_0C00680 [Torulaspora globosa]
MITADCTGRIDQLVCGSSMVDQEFNGNSNERELEETLHHLLTAEHTPLDQDDDVPMDSEIQQQKHLTLDSLLADADSEIFYDLNDGSTPGAEILEAKGKRATIDGKIIYEQILSPASLSPSSTDGSQTSGGSSGNEFTMSQVAEMKQRIINTHKLLLNFNFLKDGYARTCVEFKKAMHHLRDSEVHRAHLVQENQELRDKIAELTAKLENQ